jgi:hypothetical protein
MRHLTPGDLVDLAEGAPDADSTTHLAECEACRRQVADLRAAMAGVSSGGEIPEPSPLFWDHLSARVRDGVRNEDAPARAFYPGSFLSARRLALAAVCCVVVIAIGAALGSRLIAPRSQSLGPSPMAGRVEPGSPVEPIEPIENAQNASATPPALGSVDDPSLSLVADYGKTLDWDELREQMSMSRHTRSIDATVSELNAEERLELHRLLTEALARRPARTDRS